MVATAKLPRHLDAVELLGPNSLAVFSRPSFVGNVVIRITNVSDGPAGAHHLATDVTAFDAANRYDTAVSVLVFGSTYDRFAAGHPVQLHGRVLSAAAAVAAVGLAVLARLGRVDAEQPDFLSGDLQPVAVDDRCRAGKRRARRIPGRRTRGQRNDAKNRSGNERYERRCAGAPNAPP
jgi:hypothetical protein